MGFETVVRPVVFPNIRPAPARALLIEDAPDKGLAVITGGSNSVVDLPYTNSGGWNQGRHVEVKRTFDIARIYYTRPDGTLDKSQYWEFEVLRSITFLENGHKVFSYAKFPALDNVSIIKTGKTRGRG